jgi:hypothetical protein
MHHFTLCVLITFKLFTSVSNYHLNFPKSIFFSFSICCSNSLPKLNLWQSNPNYRISLWSISSLLSTSLLLNSPTDIFFDFMYFLFNMEIKWNSIHAWDTFLFYLVFSCVFSVSNAFGKPKNYFFYLKLFLKKLFWYKK